MRPVPYCGTDRQSLLAGTGGKNPPLSRVGGKQRRENREWVGVVLAVATTFELAGTGSD